MSNEIEIEDGVAMPEGSHGPHALTSPYRIAVNKMEVGQSFVVNGHKPFSTAQNACRRERKVQPDKKFEWRKAEGEASYRIWRTK